MNYGLLCGLFPATYMKCVAVWIIMFEHDPIPRTN